MARNRGRRKSNVYPDSDNFFAINQGVRNKNRVFYMYRRILTEIAINRFEWVNLPPGIDPRFLELTLHREPGVLFYFDKVAGRYMVSRMAASGNNMYDNPIHFTAVRTGMRSITFSADNCVPIYPNYMREPDNDIVNVFAQKLADIDRTIDINLLHQRHPFVIAVEEEMRLSAVNAFKAVQDGQFAVIGTSGVLNPMNGEGIKAFNTGIGDQVVLNTILAKQKLWNECMTLLGVNNANQDKRERLVASEVDANNDQIDSNRGIALKARNEACDLINRKFELPAPISCTWGTVPAVTPLVDDFPVPTPEGGSDSGGAEPIG